MKIRKYKIWLTNGQEINISAQKAEVKDDGVYFYVVPFWSAEVLIAYIKTAEYKYFSTFFTES